MISRSLQVPGSPSSALMTKYLGLLGSGVEGRSSNGRVKEKKSNNITITITMTRQVKSNKSAHTQQTYLLSVSALPSIKLHFIPVGNPAPPLPLSPESLISWIIQAGPF